MSVSLRPATDADREFLLAVFASARILPEGFAEMQYAAQERHYRAAFSGVTYSVVLVDGEPAGRLCVARGAESRLLDIALLPAYRGRGVGGELIAALLDEGRPVRLHVARGNPARGLYERLGFVVTGEHGPDLEMVWTPRKEVGACAS